MRIKSPFLLYIFSFIAVSLSSGLVYGYPHLRQLLRDDGCTLSESQLGLIFTVGSWTVQGGWFFSGIARDRFGTRNVATTSLVFSVIGIVGLGNVDQNNLLLLVISNLFLGLGSGGMLCFQPVASLFSKKWQAMIIASFSGAFQLSGLVFLILKEGTTVHRRSSFRYLAVMLVFLTIGAFFILPKNQFVLVKKNEYEKKRRGEKNSKECNTINSVNIIQDNLQTDSDSNESSVDNNEDIDIENMCSVATANTTQGENERSIFDDIKSLQFIFLLCWFSTLLIPMQYYIGTIALQLERKGDMDGKYINLFSIIYASSAVFSPIMGKLADVAGLQVSQMIATIFIACSLFVISFNEISLGMQLFGMVFYSIGRVTVFAMYFTTIGKRFGFTNYGTLAGLGLFISAILSSLQYPLIDLAAKGFEFYVNIITGCSILALGIPYCIWVGCTNK